MDNRCVLKKPERISFQREIDRLFKHGDGFISYPLRVVFLVQKPVSGATVSVLISVSKKKIKHAVDRNRMKRLIREAYRLNKAALIQDCKEKETGLLIAFLFIGKELYPWKDMEETMRKVLNTVREKLL